MGRAMRWIKKVFAGKKEGGDRESKAHSFAGGNGGAGPPVERRRWSFARPRNSVADGGGRPSVTAVVAGEVSQSQVRPCSCGQEREVEAAVVIQKAFRGYLARKALRALKSLVKLQALVRGYLVRKRTAATLRGLQALMRLQASSRLLKTAASRKSVHQDRITAHVKPVALPVVHRRRLSDGGDSAFERTPRIVEMDTCQLRSRSTRYAAERTSQVLYSYKPPAAARHLEREPPLPRTTQNTPRLGAFPGYLCSPAKGVTSPRYMVDTASSVARARCQSTPKQRNGAVQAAAAEPRPSIGRSVSRRQVPALSQLDNFSFMSSEVTSSRVDDSELSDVVTRDYYLDRLW